MNKRTAGLGGLVVVIVGILSILLGQDLLSQFGLTDSSPAPAPPASSAPPNWYEIYFTNPACLPEAERRGGVDEIIADDLLQAGTQVDVAAFDLDSEAIVNALISLEARGLRVRIVTDEDNGDLAAIRRLRRNGISVVEDKRRGLMHNKFVVIDGRIVWTGSMNFTSNGVYCNNNNLVRFNVPRLAANYLAEMDEMYDGRQFGPNSPDGTPNERLQIQGIELENYFGPEKSLAVIIARAVARAQQEILFLAFAFTDDQIGEAMLGRIDAGVQARGVFETVGSDTSFSYYPIMRSVNLPNLQVRTDGNSAIMHHKVIIVDRRTVIFGSFNFSDSANNRNDENIVIVHDATFASFFVEEFDAVWAEATP